MVVGDFLKEYQGYQSKIQDLGNHLMAGYQAAIEHPIKVRFRVFCMGNGLMVTLTTWELKLAINGGTSNIFRSYLDHFLNDFFAKMRNLYEGCFRDHLRHKQ